MRTIGLKIGLLLCLFWMGLPALLWAADVTPEDSTGWDETHLYPLSPNLTLVSNLKVEKSDPRLFMKLVYPQLKSQSMEKQAHYFNQLVDAQLNNDLDQFKTSTSTNHLTALGFRHRTNAFYFDYNSSYIAAGKTPLISVRFSVEQHLATLAHPIHQYDVLNYNLANQSVLQLKDLFNANAAYLDALSDYARKSLAKKHLPNQALVREGTTPDSGHFKHWNIHPDGILITFDEGQVAPYVYGAQTVLVPYAALKNMIPPTSPIAYCVKQANGCRGSYVLTGGFVR